MTTTSSTPDLWALTHAARRSLSAGLSTLTESQWRQQTLCVDWDVEQVVAQLTAAASVGRLRWITSIAASGFRPSVHNARRLREHLGATPAETLRGFRSVAGSTTAPSRDTAAYLGEVLVHSQDIRRPLGIRTEPDVRALNTGGGVLLPA